MGDLEDRVILYNMDDFVRPQGKYPENFYDIMLNFWLKYKDLLLFTIFPGIQLLYWL